MWRRGWNEAAKCLVAAVDRPKRDDGLFCFTFLRG